MRMAGSEKAKMKDGVATWAFDSPYIAWRMASPDQLPALVEELARAETARD